MKFLSATLAFAALASAADLPVASHLVTGPSSYVELTNTAAQPVTAWSLVITTQADGRIRRTFETVDAYLSEVTHDLPGSSPRLDRLMPGESRRFALDPVPEGADAEVIAVVLDDRTAMGDPGTLQSIFEKRAVERDQLRSVVDTFDAVLTAKQGVAALEELRDRLGPSSEGDPSTPHRSACQAVDTALQRATVSSVEQADQLIRTYAAFVQRQYQVAAKHSR